MSWRKKKSLSRPDVNLGAGGRATIFALVIGVSLMIVVPASQGSSQIPRDMPPGNTSSTTATPQALARTVVRVPAQSDGAILTLGVRSFQPPTSGAVSFSVTVESAAGREQEIGRFSMFPQSPFAATSSTDERTFSFDAGPALTAIAAEGSITVKVKTVAETPEPIAGAALTIGHVEVKTRL